MSSNTVYKFVEGEPNPGRAKDIRSKDHADDNRGSESEREPELVELLMDQVVSAYDQKNFPKAEWLLSRCLQRLNNMSSISHLHRFKSDVSNLLLEAVAHRKV